MAVAELIGRRGKLAAGGEATVNVAGIEEVVADKGYHSAAVLKRLKVYEARSYIPEKQPKGRRQWAGKGEKQG